MVRYLQSLRQREDGQALVEYALILGLIAVLAIGALTLLGQNITTILSSIATKV
jgi:pilus assembly protein Flp/PilA